MRRPTQPHDQLEHELQRLLEFQERGEVANGDIPAKGEDLKKRVRVIKNRLAAKKSREQARSYVQELESALSALSAKNEDLARRLALVEAENEALRRGNKSTPRPGKTAATAAASRVTKNHIGEPAALTQPSLQLDVVLVSMVLMATAQSPVPRPASEPSAMQLIPSDAARRVQGTVPIRRADRVRRSRKALRRAGMLRCIAHTCHRIQGIRSAD
mmetsp:Transcript_16407/g.25479  ORF Transcript_16407/g.25479 Transcript_16407/m.25479 type:complete len:215 (+) Transcript_16407:271-915(+)